ncbi:MAG: hypothetical protein FWG64_00240, partial [Firmicutes bacterium]|nr:hypothetical protein [Bacillota bacterium]
NSTLHWIEIENGNLQVRVHTWFGIANEFGDLFYYLDGEESTESEILAIFGTWEDENWANIHGGGHLLTQSNVYTAIFGGR